MDDIRILPTTTDGHVEGFSRAVDAVARERRYLGMVEGPPVEASRAFVAHLLGGGGVHLVAVDADGRVLGWCDIERRGAEGFRHVGRLGIGMLQEVRGRGLGRRLMREAIDAARRQGMERIELEVFASNTRAIALYESLGFQHEGRKRRVRKLDGVYDDDVLMALLLDEGGTMSEVTVRVAAAEEHERAAEAYAVWGYGGGVRPEDVVYIAESGGELVGVVRRTAEHGVAMLRGMQVAPEWRRRGIGSRMLQALVADLRGAECFCVPYTHLVDFYAAGGFATLPPAEAPAFLQARLAEYLGRGLSVLLMRRPAGAA